MKGKSVPDRGVACAKGLGHSEFIVCKFLGQVDALFRSQCDPINQLSPIHCLFCGSPITWAQSGACTPNPVASD